MRSNQRRGKRGKLEKGGAKQYYKIEARNRTSCCLTTGCQRLRCVGEISRLGIPSDQRKGGGSEKEKGGKTGWSGVSEKKKVEVNRYQREGKMGSKLCQESIGNQLSYLEKAGKGGSLRWESKVTLKSKKARGGGGAEVITNKGKKKTIASYR